MAAWAGRFVVILVALVLILSNCTAAGGGVANTTARRFPSTKCDSPEPSGYQPRPADEGVAGTYVVEADHSGEIVSDPCPRYTWFPPADGPMAQQWANCGYYDTEVPAANAVHSLYNGAVWIAFDPNAGDHARAVIRATATRSPQVLAAPSHGLPAPFVLTAWKRQLRLESVDDPRFDAFVTAYLFQPDANAYAPCNDGIGRPTASFWSAADER
jgi:hypothetical protein